MNIKTKIMTIQGAPLTGLNPLPNFRDEENRSFVTKDDFPEKMKKDLGTSYKVLPYLMQDRYSRDRKNMQIKTIVLENEYLKATFWPEYGGRLYSLIDKTDNRELLMKNTVFQPANIAIRNAWFSGGIEWNVGSWGHTYTTCDNLFAAVLKDNDNNEFLRMYEFERCTNVFWQMDFHLPKGAKCLICHVRIVNPFDEDTTTYWWSNIAVPDEGDTRVLSSCEDVLLSYARKISYQHLPYLEEFPGIDLSYPSRSPHSFDYFFQPEDDSKYAWEAAAYKDGLTFFEISTNPLLHKKLFCWGNHRGGKRWQEFLSEDGKGFYAEIQAGIARSQMHDKVLKAGDTLEWTQCFGKIRGDKDVLHGDNLHKANVYCDNHIKDVISEDLLTSYDIHTAKCADIPVTSDDIIHNGNGFGALEIMRMKKQNDGKIPDNLCFPISTLTDEHYPWYELLQNGVLPELSTEDTPKSYMINKKWGDMIEKSFLTDGGKHWYSLMQYGVNMFERRDTTKVSSEAEDWDGRSECILKAREAWEQSVSCKPSVWSLRNLAVLMLRNGETELAEKYYYEIMELGFVDYALASEYMTLLKDSKKYQKLWDVYESLSDDMKKADRIMIITSYAALSLGKMEFLENFFKCSHSDIREGEGSLTDVWFEYCALKLAKEKGITNPDESTFDNLINEAWEKCPPPKEIDFRMSLTRKSQYRI